jgi:hypothetical protein
MAPSLIDTPSSPAAGAGATRTSAAAVDVKPPASVTRTPTRRGPTAVNAPDRRGSLPASVSNEPSPSRSNSYRRTPPLGSEEALASRITGSPG